MKYQQSATFTIDLEQIPAQLYIIEQTNSLS